MNKYLKYWFILFILIGIFSYFSFYYYKIYKENLLIYNSINKKNKYSENKENNLLIEYNKLQKEKESFYTYGSSNKSNLKDISIWTLYFDETLVFDQIKKSYLQYKFQEIKDNLLTKKEWKTIYNKNLELNIPAIWLKVNTFSLQWKTLDKEKFFEDLDEKLKYGIVRYPNKDIIENGITLLYWHSSQNLWSKRNYSFFRKLPLLEINNKLTISSKEKDYNYNIINSKQIEIDEIPQIQEKYDLLWEENWKKYIMLITCYPINATDKRWVVIWEQN